MSFNKDGKEYTNDWFDHQLRYFNSILQEFKGRDVKFLEVGSWEGRSTCWMLDNILTSKDSSITCIDSWQGGWEHSEHDMAEVERMDCPGSSDNSSPTSAPCRIALRGAGSVADASPISSIGVVADAKTVWVSSGCVSITPG